MRGVCLAGVVLLAVGAAGAAETAETAGQTVVARLHALAAKQAVAPRSARHLLLLDGLPVASSALVARVHGLVATDLAVPLRLARGTAPADVGSGAGWPADTNCVAVVALAAKGSDYPLLTLEPEGRRVLLNSAALAAGGEDAAAEQRLRRAVNRGFGLALGVGYVAASPEPPDAMAVVADRAALDKVAENFGILAAQRWQQLALEAGLERVQGVSYRQLTVRGVMPPLNAKLWPQWEKRHNKSVAAVLKELGFEDVEAALQELRQRKE